jgi:hypothetical protein
MSEWIKCSEQLPEIGIEVLIRIPVCGHWNVEGGSYRGDGLWYGAWCSTHGKDKCYKVLEWAQMPEDAK